MTLAMLRPTTTLMNRAMWRLVLQPLGLALRSSQKHR
jgi:hypothetical protein